MKSIKYLKIILIAIVLIIASCSKNDNSPDPTNPLTFTVSTFAGSESGFANGTLADAKFNNPKNIVSDGSGNLFVADTDNHVIRKITPDGAVTTFAGSTVGYNDGFKSIAKFNKPSGIAADTDGNLYVSDTGNHKIRKISPSGLVGTFAGSTVGFADGINVFAKFNNTFGIAIDASNNVYVADSSNSKIRKISASGLVSTIAGSTTGFADGQGSAAQFSNPIGICIDSIGNLYVADSSNDKIRKISPSGAVTTIAGGITGSSDGIGANARFSAPVGITIDQNCVLYVAEFTNHKIRKIVID